MDKNPAILLFCALPSASVLLNLTTIKRDKHEVYYQLITLFLLSFTYAHFDEEEESMLPLIPVLVALLDEIASRSSSHPLMVFIWHRRPIFQLSVRSAIPSSLVLLYFYLASKHLVVTTQSDYTLYDTYKFLVFGVSWLSCFLMNLRERRKKLKIIGLKSSIPSAVYDLQKPNDRNWDNWTNDQCLNWVAYNYRERTPNMNEDELHFILNVLKKERIHGMTLPFLQKEDFVSIGISQGDAAFLFCDISKLTSRYPSQIHRDNLNSIDIDLDKWLGKKIGQTPDHSVEDGPTQLQEFKAESLEMDDEVVKNAFDLLTSDNDDNLPESEFSIAQDKLVSIDEIDRCTIDSMPPNIKEIASRRPDLVRALFQKHQPLKQNLPENSIKVSIEDASIYESALIEHEHDDWQTDSQSEMLGLLRRRRSNK